MRYISNFILWGLEYENAIRYGRGCIDGLRIDSKPYG
jgi:hypothetical protein